VLLEIGAYTPGNCFETLNNGPASRPGCFVGLRCPEEHFGLARTSGSHQNTLIYVIGKKHSLTKQSHTPEEIAISAKDALAMT